MQVPYSLNTHSSQENNRVLDSEQEPAEVHINIPSMKTPFQTSEWKQGQNLLSRNNSLYMSSPSRISSNSKGSLMNISRQKSKIEKVQEIQLTDEIVFYRNKALNSVPIEALNQKLTELDLQQNNFITVPIEILQLVHLRKLNMSQNFIASIPNYITQLKKLQVLDLRHNQISNYSFNSEGLIPLMLNIPSLREVYLCYNLIDMIPHEFCKLKLTKLGLKYNAFFELPFEMGQLFKTLHHFELDWFNYANPAVPEVLTIDKDLSHWQRLMMLIEYSEQMRENITFERIMFSLSIRGYSIDTIDERYQSIFQTLRGQSSLFRFIWNENLGLIKYACHNYPNLRQQKDHEGLHPLIYCYSVQKNRCFSIMIQFFNQQENVLGQLLIVAVKRSDITTVQLLLTRGVDVNYQSPENILGFHFGFSSRVQIIKGSTALHALMSTFGRNQAQQALSSRIGYSLMWAGANPRIKNAELWSPLHVAIKLPSLSAVKWAVTYTQEIQEKSQTYPFDFNQKGGPWGDTPLHLASNLGLVSILQLIQQMEGHPFTKNKLDYIPKGVCISSLQVIKLMRKIENTYLAKHLGQKSNERSVTAMKNRNLEHLSPIINSASANNSLSRSKQKEVNEISSNIDRPLSLDKYDLMDEMGESPINNDQKFRIPSFLSSNHCQGVSHRKLYKLNLNQVQKLDESRSIIAQTATGKFSQDSLQTQRQDELNTILREVSNLVRKSNMINSILNDLIGIIIPQDKGSNYFAQSSSKTHFYSQVSVRNGLSVSQRHLNDTNIKYIDQIALIIPIIMGLVLMRTYQKVKFNSAILSSSIMLINQLNIKPAIQTQFFTQFNTKIINQLKVCIQHNVERFPMKIDLVNEDPESELMQRQKQLVSNGLNYDLTNYANLDMMKQQEELNRQITIWLSLMHVDYQKIRKDPQLQNLSFNRGSRLTILDYESFHMREVMNKDYHSRRLDVVEAPTSERSSVSHDWFGTIKQKFTIHTSRTPNNTTSNNISVLSNVSVQTSRQTIVQNSQIQTIRSGKSQIITPLKEDESKSPVFRKTQLSVSSNSMKVKKSEQPAQNVNQKQALAFDFSQFSKVNTRSKVTQVQSNLYFKSPYTQQSMVQKHFKIHQDDGQVEKPKGESALNKKASIAWENISESGESVVEIHMSPQVVNLKR